MSLACIALCDDCQNLQQYGVKSGCLSREGLIFKDSYKYYVLINSQNFKVYKRRSYISEFNDVPSQFLERNLKL